jgi:hypothetical protein
MYRNIDDNKDLIKKDILDKFGWEVDKLIKINAAFSDYKNLDNMLHQYDLDALYADNKVSSKQMIVSFNVSSDNYDKNMCPLCNKTDCSLLDYQDYSSYPIYVCNSCCTTVYEEITEFEEEDVKKCFTELDDSDDEAMFQTLYIHYAVDSGSFDNAVQHYYKHNTLPYLTEIERELWRVAKNIAKIDESEEEECENLCRKILKDDNMKNPFMELVFKNIGVTINYWHLDKNIIHGGVYALIQISDNPNTPYEERDVCVLCGD